MNEVTFIPIFAITTKTKKLESHEKHVHRKWSREEEKKTENSLQEKHVQIIQYHTGDLSIDEINLLFQRFFFFQIIILQ